MFGMRHGTILAITVLAFSTVHAEETRSSKPRMIVGTRVIEAAPPTPPPGRLPATLEESLPPPREVTVVSAPAESSPGTLPLSLQTLLRDSTTTPAARVETDRVDRQTIVRESTIPPAPPQVIVAPMTETSNDTTTMILRQTIAVLVAVVLVLFVVGLAGAIAFRRYAPALFQVQVVGAPPTPFIPPVIAAAEQAAATGGSYVEPEPNFELGPTYEEELLLKEQESERQALAILERIADDNLALRQELAQSESVEDPAPTAPIDQSPTQTESPENTEVVVS